MALSQIDPSQRRVRQFTLFAKLVTAAALFIGSIALFYVFKEYSTQLIGTIPSNDTDAALLNLDTTFRDATVHLESGDIAGMRTVLETHADVATNPIERGVLLLTLAQLALSDNTTDGVALYKTIADDRSNHPAVRATALISLNLLYQMDIVDPVVLTAAIFNSEEPYGSMQPSNATVAAREKAYASLFAYADSLHPTAIANSYLAHYWAREAFLGSVDGATNARAHIARTVWALSAGSVAIDLNVPISRIQMNLALLYLEDSPDESARAIIDGFELLSDAGNTLLKNYRGKVPDEVRMQQSLSETTHALWRDVLEGAAMLKAQHQNAAAILADAYATYITSPEGAFELEKARAQHSDIAAFVQALTDVSQALGEAL